MTEPTVDRSSDHNPMRRRVDVATLREVGIEVDQLALAGAALPYADWL